MTLAPQCSCRILGVSPDATETQLKRAYRKLALKHHPDKGGSPEQFKVINEAFAVLSDSETRRLYDRFGKEGVQQAASGGGPGGVATPDDLFAMFFGGGQPRGPPQTEDTVMPLDISLEELFCGKRVELRIPRQRTCERCEGSGCKPGKKPSACKTCGGTGIRTHTRSLGAGMVQQVRGRCPDCRGKGTVVDKDNRCTSCAGRRVVEEEKVLEVAVQPGASSGEQIVVEGEGSQAPGTLPGDVVLVLREKPHRHYRRQGADLICLLTVDLAEALGGFKKPIKRLDGTTIHVAMPRGRVTKPGSVKRVVGQGMPIPGRGLSGDLFLRMQVNLPTIEMLGEERLERLVELMRQGHTPEPSRARGGSGNVGAPKSEAVAGADNVIDEFELEDVDV